MTTTAAATAKTGATETAPRAHELELQLAATEAAIEESETRLYAHDDARTREAHNKLLEERNVLAARLRGAERAEKERAAEVAARERAALEGEIKALADEVDAAALAWFTDEITREVFEIEGRLAALLDRADEACAASRSKIGRLGALLRQVGGVTSDAVPSRGRIEEWRLGLMITRVSLALAAEQERIGRGIQRADEVAELLTPMRISRRPVV